MLDGGTRRGEQLRTIAPDEHVIFQSNAELSANVNAGLVAERHAGRHCLRIAAHQVRPFVAIQSDAMSRTRGEELVSWSKTGLSNRRARGGVHLLARNAGFGGEQRRF